MSYLIFQNGAFWFQVRVPKPLVGRYGSLIRKNLQTNDLAIAKPLALQPAGYWLQRFAALRQGSEQYLHDMFSVDVPALSESLSAGTNSVDVAPKGSENCAPSEGSTDFGDSIEGLVRYWRQTNPHCTTSTYAEVRGIAGEFKKVVGKRPSVLQRTDIAAYRDHLIGKRRQRAAVAKKSGLSAHCCKPHTMSATSHRTLLVASRSQSPRWPTLGAVAFRSTNCGGSSARQCIAGTSVTEPAVGRRHGCPSWPWPPGRGWRKFVSFVSAIFGRIRYKGH